MDSTNLDFNKLGFNKLILTTLTFNGPWVQRPLESTILDSTTLGFNDLEFNNPLTQQTWVPQSLDSMTQSLMQQSLVSIIFNSMTLRCKDVVLHYHHHSIRHNRHHPPWLEMSSGITQGVVRTPCIQAGYRLHQG